jgi:hypothetical protein
LLKGEEVKETLAEAITIRGDYFTGTFASSFISTNEEEYAEKLRGKVANVPFSDEPEFMRDV